ncbi:hypothetical protein CAPTEDRAFT_189156 [Capitella teleta]|uniref:Uncharacterized protein n=1 Tax=Capitella teleta TaxID=283909 RepID=R7UWE1_CAPTE|nr:hypothetical protein CAPTEDRAFT_189156 [Capitella teleta]|eukprot:ELU08252.1 hypothetical protein CAPTEDRAFT_189156 [Capitella teleta]
MEKIKGKRTAAKIWLTRAANTLQELIDASTTGPESPTQGEFEAAISEFTSRLNAFDMAQENYEGVISEEDLEAEITEVAVYRECVSKTRVRAVESSSRRFRAATPAASLAGSTSSSSGVRLPKLQLPSFAGEAMECPSFWEQFEIAVHLTDVDEVNKFTYLKSCLKGEASRAIEGLSLTRANYNIAVDLLKSRYERRELLVVAHMQALLALECLRKTDASAMLELQNTLQKHVWSLAALNVTGDQFGVFLTPMISSKLPSGVRMEWARSSENRAADLQYLLYFVTRKSSDESDCKFLMSPPQDLRPASSRKVDLVCNTHARNEEWKVYYFFGCYKSDDLQLK